MNNPLIFPKKNSMKSIWNSLATIIAIFIILGLVSCHKSQTTPELPVDRDKNANQGDTVDEIFETNDFYGEIRKKFEIGDSLISSLKSLPPKSSWIESEKTFYKDLLNKSQYDILVVPFQTQHDGVDSVGRMLMSYLLAIAIEKNTGLKIAPLSIVYPALGHTARYFDENDVKSLAQQLGVSRVIWGYAGTHTPKGKENKKKRTDFSDAENILIDFTVVDQKFDNPKNTLIAKSSKWYNLPITPEILPSKIFENKLNEVMRFLGFTYDAKKTAKPNPHKDSYHLPDSPAAILDIKSSERIYKSYLLQFFGMLAPTVDHKNYLYAQSVVNMLPIDKDDIDRRLIESRAYIHLYRRPAAIKAIEGLHTLEAESLRDYIDANLPELKKSVAKLPPSIKKLLAELELFSLRDEYNNDITKMEKKEYLNKYTNWRYLLSIRLSHYNSWHRASNIDLKLLLDEIFPVNGFSAMDLSVGHNIANSSDENALKSNFLFKKHLQLYLKKSRDKLVSGENSDINIKFSTLTLLESVGIFNLIQEIYFWGMIQEMPGKSLKICDEVLNEFNGHPYFVVYKAMVLREMMKNRKSTEKKNIRENAFYLSLDAMWWNGSQNWVHRKASKYLFPVPELRPLYIAPATLVKGIGSDYPFRVNIAMFRRLRPMESLLPWAHTDMKYHSIVYSFNRSNKRIESRVINDIEGRFNGNLDKKRFYIKNKITNSKKSSAKEILTKEIESGSQDWKIYKKLSKLYINEGKYLKAKEILLKYTCFKNPMKYSSVEVSKLAHTAASLFFWKGAIEQARFFYELSTDLDSDCNKCMLSQERLYLLDGDFESALNLSLDRAKRYDSHSGYNDFMTYLHLTGQHDMSWSLFKNLLGRFDDPYIWDSAFIGKRLQANDNNELVLWARSISDMDKTIQKKQFPVGFLVMNLMDRDPDMKMVESIEMLEKETKNDSPRQILYFQPNGKVKKQWQEPIMHHSLFAKAYENIKLKNYRMAYGDLKKIQNFYGFGNMPTEKSYKSYLIWSGLKSGYEKEIQNIVTIYLVKSGARGYSKNSPPDIQRLYDSIPVDRKLDVNLELSLAAYSGADGKYDQAYKHLINSFNALSETELRPIFSLHQIFEFCDWIYNASSDSRFSNLALDWSKKLQTTQPMLANLYIIEAKYSINRDDIIRAVGIAQYLDSNSASLKKIDNNLKAEAVAWMKKNNPFTKKHIRKKRHFQKDGTAI